MRTSAHTQARLGWFSVALLVVGVAFGANAGTAGAPAADAPPPLPRPAPQQRSEGFDVRAQNEACEACHTRIADEWRGSMHQTAWTDPVFQSAYAIEQVAFCRGCHAPEADPAGDPDDASAHVGVGCVTCHVQNGRIAASRPGDGSAPHAVLSDPRLATEKACASCHQFDFPGLAMPMQNTVAEHASSDFSDTSCQGCHMPVVSGPDGARHRSHRFAVFEDPEMIRSAATVTAEREGTRAIRVEIAAAVVGHAFPTGDMFRRLEVRARAVTPDGHVIATADPVHLGRTFADRAVHGAAASSSFARRQIADTRVPPPGAGDPRSVLLRFDRPIADVDVEWTVAYQRMETAMAASFGIDQATDEIVVAEGGVTR